MAAADETSVTPAGDSQWAQPASLPQGAGKRTGGSWALSSGGWQEAEGPAGG